MEGADFDMTESNKANFSSAILKGASFWIARLKNATFESATLHGANFERAKLQESNFTRAKLQGANFTEAEMEGANFSKAELQGADFSKADFKDVKNFTQKQLAQIVYDIDNPPINIPDELILPLDRGYDAEDVESPTKRFIKSDKAWSEKSVSQWVAQEIKDM